jgi:copper chaperone CopZ
LFNSIFKTYQEFFMRLISLTLILVLLALAPGCEKSTPMQASQPALGASGSSDSTSDAAGSTAVMHVRGLACPQCAYNVDLQLLKVPGVKDVKVNLATGVVTAQLSPDNPPTREQLAAAIRETGFTLVKIEIQ